MQNPYHPWEVTPTDVWKTFTGAADFDALNQARTWCLSLRLSIGRLQRGAPVGLKQGDYNVQKWRLLRWGDRLALDGVMTAPGYTYRSGPVTVIVRARVIRDASRCAS